MALPQRASRSFVGLARGVRQPNQISAAIPSRALGLENRERISVRSTRRHSSSSRSD
jgi:hypothetical protein